MIKNLIETRDKQSTMSFGATDGIQHGDLERVSLSTTSSGGPATDQLDLRPAWVYIKVNVPLDKPCSSGLCLD